jgi:hypothetical protein
MFRRASPTDRPATAVANRRRGRRADRTTGAPLMPISSCARSLSTSRLARGSRQASTISAPPRSKRAAPRALPESLSLRRAPDRPGTPCRDPQPRFRALGAGESCEDRRPRCGATADCPSGAAIGRPRTVDRTSDHRRSAGGALPQGERLAALTDARLRAGVWRPRSTSRRHETIPHRAGSCAFEFLAARDLAAQRSDRSPAPERVTRSDATSTLFVLKGVFRGNLRSCTL